MKDGFINASRQRPNRLTENADFNIQIYDASRFSFVLKSQEKLSKPYISRRVY